MIDEIPEINSIELGPEGAGLETPETSKADGTSEEKPDKEGQNPAQNETETSSPLQKGEKEPEKVTFGIIEIEEDLKADLLTPEERAVYQSGFHTLKEIVERSDNIGRMVLTNPDITSGVVGLQPLVSMKTGEAVMLYQSFRYTGVDFQKDYSFLEFGKEASHLKVLVNDQAAENILRTYQKELGVTVPTRPLQKDEILSFISQLLNSTDIRQANLAHGLLSGFPLEDCQRWVGRPDSTLRSIPTLGKVENLDNRFLGQQIEGSDKIMRIDPISLLDPTNYEMSSSKNYFMPDTRTSISLGAGTGTIEGFGLRWTAQLPPGETTIRHLQKVMQVNRELGLMNFIDKQRGTFKVEDNIKAINIARENLHERSLKPLSHLVEAFGIFSSFGNRKKDRSQH
ncbi:MAG TPA: hypothetical protein VF303_00735 [Candidatus Nanoarchaeia archaeon]